MWSRTSGRDGSRPIAAWSGIRRRSSRRRRRAWRSTCSSPRARAAKRTSGRGFPNRSIPALIPALGAERGEALEFAVLVLLERLSPTERAAYVLREAFNYPHKEIAEVLHVEEANVRQLVTRARQHVTDGRRARVSNAEQRRLLHAFIAAAQTGDLAELEHLFAADVVSKADGGGFIRAAQKPVVGRARVAKYIATIAPWGWRGLTVTVTQANGQACVLLARAGVVVMLVTIEASPEGIDQIMWVMRPSKLTGVAASLSPHASTDRTDLERDRTP